MKKVIYQELRKILSRRDIAELKAIGAIRKDENGNFIIYVENGYEGASYIYTNVEMQYFGKRFFPLYSTYSPFS